MKYSLIIPMFIFCFGLEQVAQANMFNIPSELVCVQPGTRKVVADIFKLGDEFLVEFHSRNGELSHLPVYQTETGFTSKPGQWYKVSLLSNGSNIYVFSIYEANLDGNNGKAEVEPTEVTCVKP